jgi:hypothetical protein
MGPLTLTTKYKYIGISYIIVFVVICEYIAATDYDDILMRSFYFNNYKNNLKHLFLIN